MHALMARSRILHGDCLARLKGLPANSVDSLVCDPPAGIGFMNKNWDSNKGGRDAWIAWLESVMRECYRALKPGAHGLVWALPRTSHWTATACENAGFQIREKCLHVFGSGFPKSKSCRDIGRPELGNALKPAFEEWIMVRKPLEKGLTISQNVLKWGTGALAIDACRIPGAMGPDRSQGKPRRTDNTKYGRSNALINPQHAAGRWPANLVLSPDAAKELDRQSGTLKTGRHTGKRAGVGYQGGDGTAAGTFLRDANSGGASRFFYVAKPSRRERNLGCEGMPKVHARGMGVMKGNLTAKSGDRTYIDRQNHHPTVKPITLMRYLIRMVTPPGGTVLDCFLGSGTTGCAAKREGFRFIGIEQDASYVAIAKARIRAAEAVA